LKSFDEKTCFVLGEDGVTYLLKKSNIDRYFAKKRRTKEFSKMFKEYPKN